MSLGIKPNTSGRLTRDELCRAIHPPGGRVPSDEVTGPAPTTARSLDILVMLRGCQQLDVDAHPRLLAKMNP
jgi:hypothetical protein